MNFRGDLTDISAEKEALTITSLLCLLLFIILLENAHDKRLYLECSAVILVLSLKFYSLGYISYAVLLF